MPRTDLLLRLALLIAAVLIASCAAAPTAAPTTLPPTAAPGAAPSTIRPSAAPATKLPPTAAPVLPTQTPAPLAKVTVMRPTVLIPTLPPPTPITATPLPRQKIANVTSRGCRTGGTFEDWNRADPEWVTVKEDAEFVRAEGYVRQYRPAGVVPNTTPRMGESDSGGAGLAYEDWEGITSIGGPRSTHSEQDHTRGITGHDWLWNVQLDSEYDYLLEEGRDTQKGLHSEWENKYLPDYAKPAAGDRVVMWGRWVWDCGHPEDYHTEMHPPRALVTIREEGAIMPGQRPPPDYPQQVSNLPVRAQVARVYISGVGSDRKYAIPDVGVGNKTFEFDVALPPRPSPDAKPVWRFANDSCDGVSCSPPSAPTTKGVNVQATPMPVADPRFLHVKISNPPQPTFLVIAVSWTGMRFNEVSDMTVAFDKIRIMNDLDPAGTGEWLLVVGANGQYCTIGANGLDNANDCDNCTYLLRRSPDGKNPCQPRLFLLPGQRLRIVGMGYECDWACEPGPDQDEDIGDFYREYFGPNFGLGVHPLDGGCAGPSRTGDGRCNYKISYTITGRPSPITETPSGGPE